MLSAQPSFFAILSINFMIRFALPVGTFSNLATAVASGYGVLIMTGSAMINDLSLSPSFERPMKTVPVDRDPLLRLLEPHDVLYPDDHRLLADHTVDERAVLI